MRCMYDTSKPLRTAGPKVGVVGVLSLLVLYHLALFAFLVGVAHSSRHTVPQHLVCRVVRSQHIDDIQMRIIEVSICKCLQNGHFNEMHLHTVVMEILHDSAY